MRMRGIRRFLKNRGWVTIVLTLVAVGLLAVTGWVIVDKVALDDGGPVTGEIPAEMPEGIPIPAGAVIGESTVGPDQRLVTVEITTAGPLVDTVIAFSIGLVENGFVVDDSAAQAGGWLIRFSQLDLRGTIELTEGATGVVSLISVIDP